MKKDVDIKTIVKHGSDIWAGGDKCLLHFTPSGKQDYSNIPVVTNLDTSQLIFNRLFSYGDYLWIGTQSGLYCYNTQNQFCILYQHNPNDPHSISSNFSRLMAPVEKSSVLIWLPLHIHSAFRAESRAMSWMSSEVREEFRLL